MKAKQRNWKNRLVKTTYLMTAILVAALFLGSSASAGIALNATTREMNVTAQPQATLGAVPTATLGDPAGQVPHTGTQSLTPSESPQINPLGTPFYVYNVYSSPYNMYSFLPTNPGSVTLIGPASTTGFPSGGSFDDDGNTYGCSYNGYIYKFNIATGAATLMGYSGVGLNGMSFNRADGKWYAISSTALYTINVLTGAGTYIAALSGMSSTLIELAIDSAGNAYASTVQFSGGSNAYKVNLATGVCTLLGACGVNFCYAQDGSIDRDTGTWYHVAYVYPAGIAALYTISTSTGAATLVGNMPSAWEPDCLFIPYQTQAPHDILVKSIDAPVTGPAQASIIPKATVYNNGFTPETFNVSLKIFQQGTGVLGPYYQEGFENWVAGSPAVFPPTSPGNWTIENNNGGGTWLRDATPANGRSGYGSAYVRNDSTTNDDTLATYLMPIVANGTYFQFYYKVWVNGVPETFRIGYKNATGTWTWVATVTSTVGSKWTLYRYNLTNDLTGKTLCFGINYISADWYGLRVDDFTLPDGSFQGFEPTLGYFTGTPNWISVPTKLTNANNYWRMANNASIIYPSHTRYTGQQMAWFNSYSIPSGDKSRLQMSAPINLASYGQELLNFNFYFYQSYSYGSDKITLQISTDNGVSWKDLGSWNQYGMSNGWYIKSVSLLGYEDVTAALFGFEATSGKGYDMTIDNVTITATPVNVLETDTVQVVNLPSNGTLQIAFAAWTVPYWHNVSYQNVNVKYNVKVKAMNPGDPKPQNDVLRSSPILTYPWLHDVGITAINSPSTGPGAPSIPVSYTVKNFGQYTENGAPNWFFTNISIIDTPNTVALKKDFSDSIPYPGSYGANGWRVKRISGSSTYNWSVVSSGSFPTTYPKEGAMMLEYWSWYISSGGSDRIYTPPLNFSGLGVLKLKFWMQHDTGYSTSDDRITWQWSADGNTWYDFPAATFHRSASLQGVPLVQAWYEWKVDASAIANMSSVRLGILGYSMYGNNIFMDAVRLTQLSTGNTVWKEGFNVTIPAGAYFGPGFTKIQTDPLQTWKVGGTTPTSYYATCTESGDAGVQDEWLITPTFSCVGITQPWLSFTRYTYLYGYANLTVYYTLDNGTTWNQIIQWTSYQSTGTYETAMPALAGKPFIKLAFRFRSSHILTYEYVNIDNILVVDRAQIVEYSVPYVPTAPLNPGDSITITGVNWNPAPQPSGPHSYKAIAQTWLTGDNYTGNNYLMKTFTLTNGHDLAVQAITQPSERALWLGPGAHPVAAVIANLGTFIETRTATATISYAGNGTVVYTSTYAVTALSPGTNVTATFTSFTIAVTGNFKLRVEVPADDNNANNFKELLFGVDVTAPVSSATLNPPTPNGQNNWYVSDVTITLSATDPDSGVAAIKYQLNGGPWLDYTGVPITVNTDSSAHTLKYYAVDKVGNTEGEHTVTFKIDKTKPTITLSVTKQSGTKWLLQATVSDATSGVAKVEFYAAGALIGTVNAAPWEYLYNGKTGPCKAIVYDNAGNSETSAEVTVVSIGEGQVSQPQITSQGIINQHY